MNFYTVWLDSFGGGSAHRKASANSEHHNIEKRGYASMPRAGFELMIPVVEPSKTCALDMSDHWNSQ